MKLFTTIAAILVLGLFGCSPPKKSKSQLLDEIIEAEGLKQIAEQTKAAQAKESAEAGQIWYEQMKQRFPGLDKATLGKLRIACDKYSEAVMASWSIDDCMTVWKEAYGATFSEGELRQILASVESPLGQKQSAASKRATEALRAFITERQKVAAEAAMKERGDDMQRAFSEAKPAKE